MTKGNRVFYIAYIFQFNQITLSRLNDNSLIRKLYKMYVIYLIIQSSQNIRTLFKIFEITEKAFIKYPLLRVSGLVITFLDFHFILFSKFILSRGSKLLLKGCFPINWVLIIHLTDTSLPEIKLAFWLTQTLKANGCSLPYNWSEIAMLGSIFLSLRKYMHIGSGSNMDQERYKDMQRYKDTKRY